MAIQDKFNKPNVIYKITKDIDLDGGTLTIPAGCTLDFQGGSFRNGSIQGELNIIASYKIFYNIIFKRPTTFKTAQPEWWGANGGSTTDSSSAIQSMFDALYSCLPTINYNSYYPSAPDYRNTTIIFNEVYYIGSPIRVGEHFGLIINNLKLQALPTFEVSPMDSALTALINIRGGSLSLTIQDSIFDGGYVADGINIIYYAVDTNITNCVVRRFKRYGIYGNESSYELKIENTKIVQIESGSTTTLTSGTGLFLSEQKNDNNFTNLIIASCLSESFQVLGGTNSFVNCHFWSGTKYSISGRYNTFNTCYFDGEGLIIAGANTICDCFFSSNVKDANYSFIKLSDTEESIRWVNGFTQISGTLFRNNTTNIELYSSPIGTIDNSPIGDISFTITGNRFFKVAPLSKISSNYSEAQQIIQDIRGIGSENESIKIGSLLVQFGHKTSMTTESITYNIPFKNGCSVTVSAYDKNSDKNGLNPYNTSNSGFSIDTSCYWIAVGYSN